MLAVAVVVVCCMLFVVGVCCRSCVVAVVVCLGVRWRRWSLFVVR